MEAGAKSRVEGKEHSHKLFLRGSASDVPKFQQVIEVGIAVHFSMWERETENRLMGIEHQLSKGVQAKLKRTQGQCAERIVHRQPFHWQEWTQFLLCASNSFP